MKIFRKICCYFINIFSNCKEFSLLKKMNESSVEPLKNKASIRRCSLQIQLIITHHFSDCRCCSVIRSTAQELWRSVNQTNCHNLNSIINQTTVKYFTLKPCPLNWHHILRQPLCFFSIFLLRCAVPGESGETTD